MFTPGDWRVQSTKAEPRCNRYRNAIGFRRLLLRSLALTSLSVLPSESAARVALASSGKKAQLSDCRAEATAELSGADEMFTPGDWHLRSLVLTALSVLPTNQQRALRLLLWAKRRVRSTKATQQLTRLAPTFAYAHFAVCFAKRISGARCVCFFEQKGRTAVQQIKNPMQNE